MKEKITLSLDQHENARHGEEIFPLQKYVTPLWKEYPYVTAHWHEEAEFTRIGKGSCTYQIHLETYDVEEGDLIFIPPAVLHAISNEKEERMQSETYVFHMDFLGAKAADICAMRYLNPLMNQKLIPPFVIKKGHPLYEKAADLFEDINTEYDKKNTRIRDCYQVISVAACGGFDSILYPEYRGRCDFDRTCEKVKRSFKLYRCTLYGGTDDFRTCRNLFFQ